MLSSFELHPKLEQDSAFVLQLPLCQLRLMNNTCYPWLILVPARAGLVELFDLTGDDQHRLLAEMNTIAKIVKKHTHCDKINVAALGNVVSQLHIHVIARFQDDPDWPKPVWGGANVPYIHIDQAVQEWQHVFGADL
jgi:diadenosine tetraphosphate (Ap4A) HIT family hydrolase